LILFRPDLDLAMVFAPSDWLEHWSLQKQRCHRRHRKRVPVLSS
jgi:hypothetical protein